MSEANSPHTNDHSLLTVTDTNMKIMASSPRTDATTQRRRNEGGNHFTMAKQGQHHNDHNDPDVSRGPNEPEKATPITTGTYKKPETYEEQMAKHENPDPQPQYAKNEWHNQTPQQLTKKDLIGEQRSGSRSNEDSGTRGF